MKPHKHRGLIEMWAKDTDLKFQWYDTSLGKWLDATTPHGWFENMEYRVKPIEPIIDWSHISPCYNRLTVDEKGTGKIWNDAVYITFEVDRWRANGSPAIPNPYIPAEIFTSYVHGTIKGKEAIFHRPKETPHASTLGTNLPDR